MPKYLLRANLTAEGAAGVVKEGGSARREAVASTVEGMGGTLDSFYFAFGDTDVYGVVDMPDNVSVAAMSMAISSSGVVSISTTVLLTPEEMDEVKDKRVDFRPPGG